MSKRILHIMKLDKFIPPFIEFINKNFNPDDHIFLIFGEQDEKYGKLDAQNIKNITNKKEVFKLLKYLYASKKIIIHGLFLSEHFIQLLFLQPWLLKKCYWVMWGGDFYFPEKQGWIKKQVIKKMGHFITYIKGDYELVQKWYGANGEWHECFMYLSNLYKEYNIKEKSSDTINIQVGNSATHTNNHLEVFDKLLKYKNENIKIFTPLSYGDEEYASKVIAKGKELFGDKFVAITEFMPFEKYLDFLASIDIAIFNHNRQQAMGNIITLLGLGKKVYIRKDVVQWKLFEELNIKVFDVNDINIKSLNNEIKYKNKRKIKEYFSEKNYLRQLKKLFEE